MSRLRHLWSRRAVLRGAGLELALPFLPAAAGRTRREAPLRLVFVYVPNGLHMPHWTPSAEGPLAPGPGGGELPPLLLELERHLPRLSVFSGLTVDKARANGDGPGDHARAAAAFLTCTQPVKADGTVVRVGTSADQVVARAVGDATRLPSLQLGCDGGMQSGQCDSGYPCVYSSNLSWAMPHTPMTHETNPRLVFDRLFGVGLAHLEPEERARRVRLRLSVLDFVRDDARALARELSASDRRKLEQLLEGVRALELRIQRASDPAAVALERPTERPEDFGEHASLLFELLTLALATDTTRVATFLVANEGSNRTYRDLGVREGHHSLSHHGDDPEKQEQIARINRYHVGLLGGFLDRLAETGVLDDTLVVFGSGIADGNRHAHHDLPLLVAGGGGRVPLGIHRRFEPETPMANLYLALFERFGIRNASFGDSTGTLAL